MATKTLGLTGRDYSTFAAYASYVNALTFTANEFCDAYNDGEIVDSTSVSISSYNANGFNLAIRAVNGHGFADHANKLTNALRYNAANGLAFSNSASYAVGYVFSGANLTVTGLQLRSSAANTGQLLQLSNGVVLNRLICKHIGGSYIVGLIGSGGATINDSLIYTSSSAGFDCGTAGLNINGCTIAKTGGATTNGIVENYPLSPVVKNTVLYGFLNDIAGVSGVAGGGTTNNATSKAAFGGTGWGVNGQVLLTAADFENVTTGSEDFRIAAGSTKLPALGAVGAGSGSSVIGVARSGTAPSISAWEVPSGGGAAAGVTATGPSGGVVNVGSTNFNIGVTPPGGTITGTVIVTPSDGGGGGSFTPATVSLTTASPTATLTYTPTSIGAKTISFTNNGGLTNPGNITYTVNNGGAGTFTTPTLKNNAGTILANITGVVVNVYNPTSGALVVRKTGLSSNGSGVVTVTDAALSASTVYAYEVDLSATSQGRRLPTGTAS